MVEMIVKHVGAFFIEWEILFSIRVVPRRLAFVPWVSPRTRAFFNELKILSNYVVKGEFKCGYVYAYALLLLNLPLPSTWNNLFNSLNRRYCSITSLKANLNNVNKKYIN